MTSSRKALSKKVAILLAFTWTALGTVRATAQRPVSLDRLVPANLWADDETTRREAEATLTTETSLTAVSRLRFHDLEEIIRRDRPWFPPPPALAYGAFLVEEIEVTLPDGRTMPILVRLPPQYNPVTAWPLLLAMHGGPPGGVRQARQGAERMVRVWKDPAADAGWIIAAPAMTTVVSAGGRTEDRLPYEILRPEQMEAILADLSARFRIDPNRVVSTGISLGSNFSIAFGCGLMLKSLYLMQELDPGFDAARLLTARFEVAGGGNEEGAASDLGFVLDHLEGVPDTSPRWESPCSRAGGFPRGTTEMPPAS